MLITSAGQILIHFVFIGLPFLEFSYKWILVSFVPGLLTKHNIFAYAPVYVHHFLFPSAMRVPVSPTFVQILDITFTDSHHSSSV